MAFSLFGKRDQPEQHPGQPATTPEAAPTPEPAEQKRGFFDRMKQAVTRTRESFTESISSVIALTREVDESTFTGL
ncbi:MAG: signal recognition particle-docking protein FtsY, partial [Edaphobacter sp.]